jgi:BMFP domain-containing protein YqiC
MDPKILDELSRRLAAALPPGITTLKDDLEKNIRTALTGITENLNLVSREEFEVQQKVLERTRIKLEALEKQLIELEKNLS